MEKRRQHSIDFLFPVALFFLFTLSAVIMMLFASRIYQSSVEQASRNDDARTALSYISEKVHQNDVADALSLGTFDGCEALILKQTYGETSYYTYIYAHDGALKELFLQEGAVATAANGKAILSIDAFSISQTTDRLFKCSCTDTFGNTSSILIGCQSQIN